MNQALSDYFSVLDNNKKYALFLLINRNVISYNV